MTVPATVRAAVVVGFGDALEIREIRVPELEPGGLLVKVEVATLCGTDVHRWLGHLDGPHGVEMLPFIPGHEACGVVEAINGRRYDMLGAELVVGDRVIWSYPTCGKCYWCLVSEQTAQCENTTYWGRNRADRPPYLLGACAEYQYLLPGCSIVHVPDEMPGPTASAASCAFRTVMHGGERLGRIAPHETVLVQGCGPVGLCAAALARHGGARSVLCIGAPAIRLELARRFGADEVLNLEETADPAARRQWVLDRTGGRGADVVIQCATLEAVPEGLSVLRAGGRYVSIGIGGNPSIPVSAMPSNASFILSHSAAPRHWLQAIEFVQAHPELPWEEITTERFALEDATTAFQQMAAMKVVKAVLVP